MSRIAFLTSFNMAPGSDRVREDVREFHLQFGALSPACSERGLTLEPVVWSTPNIRWRDFEAAVIGTTWDYWDQRDAFVSALTAIEESGVPLYNPASCVSWNIDKRYLGDLAARGLPTIPTLWAATASEEVIERGFTEFETDTIVVKPCVSAGAWRLAKISRGEPLPPPDRLPLDACLVQPFLDDIVTIGEVSLMTYDGRVSHGVRKIPQSDDFRVQSIYGAREVFHQPMPAEIELAEQALAAATTILGTPLLYARVDLAPGPDGQPLLIELEAIEPYHYPEQGPDCGAAFAEALARRLEC